MNNTDIWNNHVKSIKKTYHFVTWFLFEEILELKDKHLVGRSKQKSLTDG